MNRILKIALVVATIGLVAFEVKPLTQAEAQEQCAQLNKDWQAWQNQLLARIQNTRDMYTQNTQGYILPELKSAPNISKEDEFILTEYYFKNNNQFRDWFGAAYVPARFHFEAAFKALEDAGFGCNRAIVQSKAKRSGRVYDRGGVKKLQRSKPAKKVK